MNALYFLAALFAVAGVAAAEPPLQITSGDQRDVDPAVSPDGKYLAFASDRTGKFDIYVLKFGEAGVKQITQSDDEDRHPAWSADNARLVFNSNRTGTNDLFEVARDGGAGFLQLTDAPDNEDRACYPPKDDGLLYVRAAKSLKVRKAHSIVWADARGSANNARQLAEGDEPRISPDGKRILFTSHRTKNSDVWIMGVEGGAPTQLTSDAKDDENPAWSPDGKRIVFASNRAGNFDLWTMDADGGNVRQLTTDPLDETQPVWSAGGYLYYVRESAPRVSNICRIKAP